MIQIQFLWYKFTLLLEFLKCQAILKFIKVQGTDHPALYFNEFEIEKPYWICENREDLAVDEQGSMRILDKSYDFKFQNRHYQTPILGLEKKIADNGSIRYLTRIEQPFRAIVPGQVTKLLIFLK